MKCRNCGQKLSKEDAFCGNCGTPVPARSSRKGLYIAISLIVILTATAGIGLAIKLHSDSSEEIKTDLPAESEQTTEGDNEAAANNEAESDKDAAGDTDPSDSPTDNRADADSPFTIDPSSDADYTAILDPSEYKFYASQIPDFNFWYPQNFYNHVSYSTEPYETSMGTNEETIIFTAEDTSQLRFLAIRRTDSLDLDTMAKTIYTSELGLLTSSEVIINDVKDHSGKIIVTGWDKQYPDNTVYSLTRVTNDYILQMKVLFPSYTAAEDEHQKGYLTETYYRMCGFSDADPWRSYAEYLSEVQ